MRIDMTKVVTERPRRGPRKAKQEVGATTRVERARRRGSWTDARTDRAASSVRLERQGVLRSPGSTPPIPA